MIPKVRRITTAFSGFAIAQYRVILIAAGIIAAVRVVNIGSAYQNSLRFVIIVSILTAAIYVLRPIQLYYMFVLAIWIPFSQSFEAIPLVGRLLRGSSLFEAAMLCLGSIWLLFHCHDTKAQSIRRVGLYWPWFLMVLGGLIALPNSYAPLQSLIFFRHVVVYTMISFMVTAQILRTPNQAVKTIQVLLVSWCIMTVFVIWSKESGQTPEHLLTAGGTRLGGYFSLGYFGVISAVSTTLSSCLAVLFPLAYSFSINGKTMAVRTFGLATGLILLTALILCFGRGSYFAVTAAFLTVSYFSFSRKPLQVLGSIGGAVFALLLAYYFVGHIIPDEISFRLKETVNPLQAQTFLSRASTWENAMQIQPERLLIGWGFMGNPIFPAMVWEHNSLLYYLNGTGILGTIGYFWLLIKIFLRCRRATRFNDGQQRTVAIGVLGSIVAIVICGITHHWPSINFQSALMGIVLGIGAAIALPDWSALSDE